MLWMIHNMGSTVDELTLKICLNFNFDYEKDNKTFAFSIYLSRIPQSHSILYSEHYKFTCTKR